MTTLPSITREYTFGEIATMTRVAPAKLLGPERPWPFEPRRTRRCRGLQRRSGSRANVPLRPSRVQGWRPRGSRRTRDALSLWPHADGSTDLRRCASTGGFPRYYDDLYGVSRDLFKVPPRTRSVATMRSRRSHAANNQEWRAHRRDFRRGFSDARHGARHHRAEQALGAAGGDNDDRLCDFGHRLRRRGRHRLRGRGARDARRAAGRARPDLRHVDATTCRRSSSTASVNAC